jgi:glycerol-3-phosphate acyltransferase PlsY
MYFDRLPILIGGVFIGLMAVFMHRGNIVRLLKGTERKFSFKKESAQ